MIISKSYNQSRRRATNGPSAAVVRYDEGADAAPTVVAQGTGEIARQLIAMAQKNDIPIQENSSLVQNLLDMDLGENIPPQLYNVMAEIFLLLEEIERKY